MPARPETLLKTDKATVMLELGRDGKFVVKTSSWEDNRTILAGERLQIENIEGIGRSLRCRLRMISA
jgi:hypothetical protein